MSTVADVIAAIDAEGSTSWQIADEVAALEEVDPVTGKPLTLQQVADRIEADGRGHKWSPKVLSSYRATARAFPREERSSLPTQTFVVAYELRAHPDKLRAWKPRSDGAVLTQERARALRGSASTSKAKTDAWRTELRRAFTTIARLAEKDPAFVLDMLEQTIGAVTRNHGKQLKKAGRVLRAV